MHIHPLSHTQFQFFCQKVVTETNRSFCLFLPTTVHPVSPKAALPRGTKVLIRCGTSHKGKGSAPSLLLMGSRL